MRNSPLLLAYDKGFKGKIMTSPLTKYVSYIGSSKPFRGLVALLVAALLFSPLLSRGQEEPPEDDQLIETYNQLKLFADVFERTKEDYVEEVSDEELMEYAIDGMLSALDPHSSYLPPDALEDMRIETRGEFGGLGIEVTMQRGYIEVVAPIDDTPAAKAGLMTGDYITHLDGEPVQGMNLNEAVDIMRGEVGSEIVLTIARQGQESALEIPVVRDIIKVRSVRHHIENGSVGYIRISTFTEQTTPGLEKAVADIREELGEGLKGFVLDLRLNPGGLLTEAISVSDAFLERGEIVSTRGRHLDESQRFNARSGDITDGLPLVVLIDGGSASASEIVAGALQDHRRAVVMGTQSFGKGSVQTILPLLGHGAMRLTTSRYYTPSGRSIQAEGITPDILVEQARIETLGHPRARREADLRGALKNDSGSQSEADDNDTEEQEENSEGKKDYQLQRAVDLIEGAALFQLAAE